MDEQTLVPPGSYLNVERSMRLALPVRPVFGLAKRREGQASA